MLEKLEKIYNENINWLNFAELKNGVLLAFGGAFIQIILENFNIIRYGQAVLILCGVAIVLSSASFLPFLNNNRLIKWITKMFYKYIKRYKSSDDKVDDKKNIIFYVSIFLCEKGKYSAVVEKEIGENNSVTFLEKNYIDQIISISTIASIKYFFFTIAMYVFLIAVVLFFVFYFLGPISV